MSIDKAREELNRSLRLSGAVFTQQLVDAIEVVSREAARDEIARLSPAPVGGETELVQIARRYDEHSTVALWSSEHSRDMWKRAAADLEQRLASAVERERLAWAKCDEHSATIAERDRRIAGLEAGLGDLMTWFPEKPAPAEWRLPAGEFGANDAIEAARALLTPATDKGSLCLGADAQSHLVNEAKRQRQRDRVK